MRKNVNLILRIKVSDSMARSENSGGMFRYKCKNYPKCEAIFLSNKKEEALKQKAKHEKTCSPE